MRTLIFMVGVALFTCVVIYCVTGTAMHSINKINAQLEQIEQLVKD